MGMPLRGDSIHEGSGSGCEVLHLWLREALRHGAPALGDAGPQAEAFPISSGVDDVASICRSHIGSPRHRMPTYHQKQVFGVQNVRRGSAADDVASNICQALLGGPSSPGSPPAPPSFHPSSRARLFAPSVLVYPYTLAASCSMASPLVLLSFPRCVPVYPYTLATCSSLAWPLVL